MLGYFKYFCGLYYKCYCKCTCHVHKENEFAFQQKRLNGAFSISEEMHRMFHYKLPYYLKLRRLVNFWSFLCGTYSRVLFNQWWRFFKTLTSTTFHFFLTHFFSTTVVEKYTSFLLKCLHIILTTKRKRSHFIIDYTLLSSASVFSAALMQGWCLLTIWMKNIVRIWWGHLNDGGTSLKLFVLLVFKYETSTQKRR